MFIFIGIKDSHFSICEYYVLYYTTGPGAVLQDTHSLHHETVLETLEKNSFIFVLFFLFFLFHFLSIKLTCQVNLDFFLTFSVKKHSYIFITLSESLTIVLSLPLRLNRATGDLLSFTY